MTCLQCRWKYPEGIVQPAFINGQYFNLCAICYEEVTGVTLQAPLAVEVRERALEYRRRHPKQAPHKARNNKIVSEKS